MKVLYLSLPCFFDADAKIIENISTYAEITYVLVRKRNSPLDISYVKAYCSQRKINLIIFEAKYRQRDPRSVLQFLSLNWTLKKNSFDVCYIYCNDHPVASFLSVFFKRKNTIVFIHDVEFHSNYANAKILRLGRAITLCLFNRFQVFSEWQLDKFKKRYPNKNVVAIPLTLQSFGLPKKFIPLTIASNKYTFLFFGKILPYKGLRLLIEAMNILCKKFADVHLIIAGKCEKWNEYENAIENKQNFSTFIDHIPDVMVADLFARSNFLILPYLDATQSGPLMIAYNYNLPVIASDIPSFREFVEEGTTGYLFERNNVTHLVEVLERVRGLNNADYISLKKRMRIFTNSHYSMEAIAPKYREMFHSVMHS